MMMKTPVCSEGELIFSNGRYAAFVENISEDGMYMSIAHIMTKDHIRPKLKLYLKVQLLSGQMISFNCRDKWSERNTPQSHVERIGMEIINPPEEFI